MASRFFINKIKIGKNCKIGKNNIFGENVIIKDNVIIGNNNKIYDNCIIYPNTKIGNKNIILENNMLGPVGVQSSYNYDNFDFKYNGLIIGNNNFFHINNIIFNGFDNETIIGNNNKFLSENHISHDSIIYNNVIMYPRSMTAGHCILLNNSVMGMNSSIQQRMVLGNYSMIGANNFVANNVFPFYIYYNNKYIRINKHAMDDGLYKKLVKQEDLLLKIINYKNNTNLIKNIDIIKEINNLLFPINKILFDYISECVI